jgi:hypothetical protein
MMDEYQARMLAAIGPDARRLFDALAGLTWLGVLGAVILGGFIVRACH